MSVQCNNGDEMTVETETARITKIRLQLRSAKSTDDWFDVSYALWKLYMDKARELELQAGIDAAVIDELQGEVKYYQGILG